MRTTLRWALAVLLLTTSPALRAQQKPVVVIFDTRLFTKGYGAEILGSLPDCRVTRDLDELEKFFKSSESSVE